MRHELLRLAPDGESWDTLGTFDIRPYHWTGTAQEPLQFSPFAFKVPGGDALYYLRGESFEIERFDAAGRLDRIIRLPLEPRPVTEALKTQMVEWTMDRVRSSPRADETAVERMRQSLVEARWAETLPAFSHAFLDDEGYLWAEQFRWSGVQPSPIATSARWSVLDSTGVWLGDVEVPPGFILREATRDRALGFVVDELGVKEVEVYGLARPGS